MPTRIANNAASTAVSCLAQRLNAGSIVIKTSTQPTEPDASAHGTTLVTFTIGDPAFAAATDAAPGAIVSANGITAVSAVTSGKAGYFRASTSGGTTIIDGQATSAAGGGQMTLNSVDIDQDQLITINTWTITMPES